MNAHTINIISILSSNQRQVDYNSLFIRGRNPDSYTASMHY